MKLDLNYRFLDLEGQPATQTTVSKVNKAGQVEETKEVPLTLALALKTCFNFVDEKQRSETPVEDFVKRGHWITSINKGECPDFKVEDLTAIKKMAVAAGFNPLILGQIDALIEGEN